MIRCLRLLPLSLALASLACSSSPEPSESGPGKTSTSGSGSSPSGSSCSFSGPIPVPPPSSVTNSGGFEYGSVPPGTSVQAYVEALGYAYLDSFVGTYLRGDATVYQGTFSAHDNQSVLGDDCGGNSCQNQSISSGDAVASLVVNNEVATLTVSSLSQHEYVVFQQGGPDAGAGVTAVGLVLPDTSAGGNIGTCDGCLPSFTNTPSTITFQGLMSTAFVAVAASQGFDAGADASAAGGTLTDAGLLQQDVYAGVPLHTYASASLNLATPCDLTFPDLVELNAQNALNTPVNGPGNNSASETFVAQSGEMVATILGSAYSESNNYCTTYYSVELYVNLSNLADYGVRNFQVSAPDAGYEGYGGNICP